jgi:hypothetical protein
MPNTPNGFPVLEPDSPLLVTFKVADVAPFRVARLALPLVKHLTKYLHALEPVTEAGWDGGYAHRLRRGSTTSWSEHAAGTAIDWNASQHPMGAARYAGWDATQVRMIRWYLGTSAGRLWRWGADFDRPDSMHFELESYAAWKASEGWWKK